MPEVLALACAPPLMCASPLRGSSVAVDPIEGVPVTLVALGVDELALDSPTDAPLDGEASDSTTSVDEAAPVDAEPALDEELLVEDLAPVVDVLSAAGVVPIDASVVPEPESVGSAPATPGEFATATPMPSATANAPTRPI